MQSRMDRYNTIVPKDKEASQQKEVRKIGASRKKLLIQKLNSLILIIMFLL